ncbi:MAG: PIN domain-containing protein [Betaproteobacteria bacterium]|nr:PIN domain-containing protein [Betaproteobacteria bacterium]
MTVTLYLDTHVLVWLYQDGAARLTARGTAAIDGANRLLISPIVELELAYLHEIGRITCPSATILDTLRRDLDLESCKLPFASVVGAALQQSWTRDPFDRLIVAQAAHGSARLLTADRSILKHYPFAYW